MPIVREATGRKGYFDDVLTERWNSLVDFDSAQCSAEEAMAIAQRAAQLAHWNRAQRIYTSLQETSCG